MPVFEQIEAPEGVVFRSRVTDNFTLHLLKMEEETPRSPEAAALFDAARAAGRGRELRLTRPAATFLAQHLDQWSKRWDQRWSVLPQRRGDARRAWGLLQSAWRVMDELKAEGFEVSGR